MGNEGTVRSLIGGTVLSVGQTAHGVPCDAALAYPNARLANARDKGSSSHAWSCRSDPLARALALSMAGQWSCR